MTISQGMTYALAAALAALSARAAFAPRGAAVAYGVPIPEGTEPTPYLEVKANRDLTLAGLLIVTASADHASGCGRVDRLAPRQDFRYSDSRLDRGVHDCRRCPCHGGALTCIERPSWLWVALNPEHPSHRGATLLGRSLNRKAASAGAASPRRSLP